MIRLLSTYTQKALPLLGCALIGCTNGAADEDPAVLSSENALAAEVVASTSDTAPTATVKQGKLQGKLVNTTREFLGIPYAKAPIGALRFAPPQAAPGWSGTRSAVAMGPSCPQPAGALAAPGPQSEDCLTLNVYAPNAGAKLPVMVFVHGGAFVGGGSIQYDAQRLSEQGKVIVVTFNYRLGALGLFAHPALDAVRGTAPSGNDALRDQQLALAWVKANIESFKGDPANVTLFGESAGSL
ncbi:MAG TPA: carboxylesterase family protein, partial [Polyangiales bacterium]|nr:carboxylesterase family protein [Polyangiales bacterium]